MGKTLKLFFTTRETELEASPLNELGAESIEASGTLMDAWRLQDEAKSLCWGFHGSKDSRTLSALGLTLGPTPISPTVDRLVFDEKCCIVLQER